MTDVPRFVLTALVVVVGIGPTVAALPQSFGPLDEFLARLAAKNKAMGSLAVAVDGHVRYSRGFGYSYVSDADRREATTTTKYRIASVTKTYTAAMVFQLIDEGRLTLTDRLDRFFPQIPNARRITIAQMLAHRSGIHDLDAGDAWAMQRRTADEVVARIAEGPPDFEPDTRHQYSNAGYILLGRIVETVDGRPYAAALHARIGAPLGLRDTHYLEAGTTNASRNESVSYRYLGGWRPSAELDFSVTGGAGAIVATPTDMAAFIHGLFERKLVSAAGLAMMTTIRDGEGMGLETFTFAGRTFYGHTGGSGSSGAWLAYDPEQKLAIAYATNLKIYPVVDIVGGALDIFWNRPFIIPTFDTVEVSPDVLDRYVGVYSTAGAPVKMTITRQGSTLYFQPPGQAAVPLEATAMDRFKIDPGIFFAFDGEKGLLTITRPNGERVFTKDARGPAPPPHLQPR